MIQWYLAIAKRIKSSTTGAQLLVHKFDYISTQLSVHSSETESLHPTTRWMFLIKRDANGDIERYKARLVAKGFSQRPGFDYFDTFAPTARWSALRALLSIAAIEDLEIDQIDISNVFLNRDVDADIYVDQPEGFVQGDPEEDKLHLHKGLYSLKQSPRLWHGGNRDNGKSTGA